MAKKGRRNKKKSDQTQDPMPPINPLATEQIMQNLTRMMQDKDFESEEAMNQFLQEQLESGADFSLPPQRELTDLEKAQDLIYEAQEARTKKRALTLARKALELSHDCADAYVMLAEINTRIPAEKIAFYEAGVRAGERALGDDFDEYKGHFWGIIETRPYMRARLGLATILWESGRLEEAADHMQAMLELNPNDNQGVRHVYITLLLELEDNKRLPKLLKQFPDDWSAYWKYGHALYEFRRKGASKQAEKLLLDAIDYNPHVVDYLLGKKKIPRWQNEPYYSPGDETEAIDYVTDGIRPWSNTEGAHDWLKMIVEKNSS